MCLPRDNHWWDTGIFFQSFFKNKDAHMYVHTISIHM